MSMYAVSDAHSLVRADAASLTPAKFPLDPRLIDLKKNAAARKLFELEQLEVSWDDPTGTLWTFMRPRGRPSYNLDLLDDFHAWQRGILAAFEQRPSELRYLAHAGGFQPWRRSRSFRVQDPGGRPSGGGRLQGILRAHPAPEHQLPWSSDANNRSCPGGRIGRRF